VTKDGENAGIEDPKCANHLMSAARYALTMFAGKDSMYDPERRQRDHIDVSDTRAAVDGEWGEVAISRYGQKLFHFSDKL
jgi:hypothetical protein